MSGRGALTVMFALFLGVSLCALFLAAQLRDPYSAEPRMVTIRVDDHRGRPIPMRGKHVVRLTFVDLNGKRIHASEQLHEDGVFREPHPGVPCDVVVAAIGHRLARIPLEGDEHTVRLERGLPIAIACKPSDGGDWRGWRPTLRIREAGRELDHRFWPRLAKVAANDRWLDRADGTDRHGLRLEPDPDTGILRCSVPAAGHYRVSLVLSRGQETQAREPHEAGVSIGGATTETGEALQALRELSIRVGAQRRFPWVIDVRRLEVGAKR